MHPRRLALVGLGSLVGAVASSSLAYGSPSQPAPQEAQLDRTCSATLTAIAQVMNGPSSRQPPTIVAKLDTLTPGVLSAKIVFNRSGSSVHVGRDRLPRDQSSSWVRCAQTVGHTRGLGPGQDRTVAALHVTFAKPGRHTLKFVLNPAGRKLLAQVRAAQRAYRQAHPQGHQVPGIAYGVGLVYSWPG